MGMRVSEMTREQAAEIIISGVTRYADEIAKVSVEFLMTVDGSKAEGLQFLQSCLSEADMGPDELVKFVSVLMLERSLAQMKGGGVDR